MAQSAPDWVCSGCIGDDYLVAEMERDGMLQTCSYCKESGKCYSLGSMADRVHDIFSERYQLASYPYDNGDSSICCVAEILGIDEGDDVAEAFHDYLAAHHRGWPGDGDENPYGDDHSYVEAPSNGYRYASKWRKLARSLRHESRYFNSEAHTILEEIFHGLDFGLDVPLALFDPPPPLPGVVTLIGPGTSQAVLYRAREARDTDVVAKYLQDPFNHLSAPPPPLARAGRMNPTGISLFYGSFDPETCIAEIRPPVGTYAVIARFEVLRPLRLLDFLKLTKAGEPLPHFHPNYLAKRDRDAFLKAFASDIAIPVHPQDENLGYLPTQAVAEYLAQRKDLMLDGLLFASTQTGKSETNVVLFQHAAHVEPLTLTHQIEWGDHFDEFPGFTLITSPVSASLDDSQAAFRYTFGSSGYDWPSQPPPPPTLRLDSAGFVVELIGTVEYKHSALPFEYTTAEERDAERKRRSELPF